MGRGDLRLLGRDDPHGEELGAAVVGVAEGGAGAHSEAGARSPR